MKPELISFDAAGTLIDVNWRPGAFAVQCARDLGMPLEEQSGAERYDRLLGSRWQQYCLLNQTRDDSRCDDFWIELAADWLAGQGQDPANANQLVDLANSRLYSPDGKTFALFKDARPALNRLAREGWRMVLLSNWDYSLHRVARYLGITDYFEMIFASLQEGPEKPDPALFEIVSRKTGVATEAIVHIGDHPVDDLQGARDAGLQAIFLDRGRPQSVKPTLATLNDLPGALEWLY